MAKTSTERYDAAMKYLHQNISSELAIATDTALVASNKCDIGAELSLKGAGFKNEGTKSQHEAVRALLLCQKAFLKAPHAKNAVGAPHDYNTQPDLPKELYVKKPESEVRQALYSYRKVDTSTAELARAATEIQNPCGILTWETLTRSSEPFRMMVCFDAVRIWLFKAGFVSIRWLTSTGPRMVASTANDILGQGTVIQPAQLATMPRGHLFNFHKSNDKAVCHWGVSLGGGVACASNTVGNWLGAAQAVRFRSGNDAYGEFPMADSYEVCRFKYGSSANVPDATVIRQIDPAAVATYF